ncbi:hypothetical protein, partial [Sinorhizobium meliloti]
ICHANLQIVLETFSHTQQASKYSQSNGAETALTIKPLGIRKLKGNSLTAPDRNRALRLHDVVHASLDGSWCTNERSVELEHLLDTYLVEASRGEGLDFWRNARILLPKLEDMVARGGTPPSFLFALLTTWDALETRPELVGEPLEIVRRMVGRKPGPLGINMVIESIEQLFLYDKERHDPAAQEQLLLATAVIAADRRCAGHILQETAATSASAICSRRLAPTRGGTEPLAIYMEVPHGPGW